MVPIVTCGHLHHMHTVSQEIKNRIIQVPKNIFAKLTPCFYNAKLNTHKSHSTAHVT